MAYVIIKHNVEDFDKWKEGFDNAAEMRSQAGEKSVQIFRDSEDQNLIFGVVEFESKEQAQAFFGSEELKAKMGEAGVVGEPAIYFVDKID